MPLSEINAKNPRTGTPLHFSNNILCSSANAPWRKLVRVEQHERPPCQVEIYFSWDTIVVHSRRGTVEQRADGGPLQKFVIKTADVQIYPAGMAIRAETPDAMNYVVIQVHPNLLSAVGNELEKPAKLEPMLATRDIHIERISTLLHTEVQSGCASGQLYGETLGRALTTYLLQHYSDGPSRRPEHKGGLPGSSINRVVEYIQAHAGEDIALQELADLAHLSPYHFCRLFKQSTGLTPYQYVLRFRIERAKQLLSRNLDITSVGLQLGFKDQSHFTAIFRKLTGMTPNRWRRGS